MSKMEFKGKTETEALEKIANAPLEHHWGCDQILIDGCHFAMSDVQDYAKATLKNKPQLTILKSIADELNKPDALWNGMGTPFADHPEAYRAVTIRSLNYALNYNASYNWNTEVKNIEYVKENYALVSAYLAGKALGVDLVKVGEGEIWN